MNRLVVETSEPRRLGTVTISDVEVAAASYSFERREYTWQVWCRVQRMIEAEIGRQQLPAAMRFRRALQGCE
jgi:hypothetical protein